MSLSDDIRNELPEEENARPAREERASSASVNAVAVALRSAFWTVVTAILVFACVLTFSPYTAMRMYDGLGNKDLALYNAERYMRRNETAFPAPFGKYADALYLAVNTSTALLHESIDENGYDADKTQYYARRVEKYATRYLDANTIGSLYERTVRIDEYSRLHTVPRLHPYVYSYTDRLTVERFTARYLLGMREELDLEAQTATTMWKQEGWTPTDSDFLLLAELSAYIDRELDRLGLTETIRADNGLLKPASVRGQAILMGNRKPFDLFVYDAADRDQNGAAFGDGATTALYDTVTDAFDAFVSYVRTYAKQYTAVPLESRDVNEHRKYTYYTKTLRDFSTSVTNMTALFYGNNAYFDEEFRSTWQQEQAAWEDNRVITDIPNGNKFIDAFYEDLLADYLKFYYRS